MEFVRVLSMQLPILVVSEHLTLYLARQFQLPVILVLQENIALFLQWMLLKETVTLVTIVLEDQYLLRMMKLSQEQQQQEEDVKLVIIAQEDQLLKISVQLDLIVIKIFLQLSQMHVLLVTIVLEVQQSQDH